MDQRQRRSTDPIVQLHHRHTSSWRPPGRWSSLPNLRHWGRYHKPGWCFCRQGIVWQWTAHENHRSTALWLPDSSQRQSSCSLIARNHSTRNGWWMHRLYLRQLSHSSYARRHRRRNVWSRHRLCQRLPSRPSLVHRHSSHNAWLKRTISQRHLLHPSEVHCRSIHSAWWIRLWCQARWSHPLTGYKNHIRIEW